jgi:hypothetical protein
MALTTVNAQMVSGAITTSSTGNVSIGSTTVSSNLSVYGAGSGTFSPYNDPLVVQGSDYSLLYVKGTNGISASVYSYNASNGWYTGTNNSASYRIGYMSTIDSTGITNAKDGSTGITIDTSGNVGISTTSPSSFGALAIRRGVSGTYLGITASSSFEASDNINNSFFIMHNNANGSTCFLGADASRLQVFNSSTGAGGVYLQGGGTSWTSASDERVKENLEPIKNGLAKVASLRAVTGNYIKDETKQSKAFLIAQDVQSVLPEAVDSSNPDELGLQYTDLIPLLVAAIKELKAELDATKAEVAALKAAP